MPKQLTDTQKLQAIYKALECNKENDPYKRALQQIEYLKECAEWCDIYR